MIYQDITPEWFAAIESSAIAETGIPISGENGTASSPTPLGSITIQWAYDPNSQTLVVGCTHKPWLLPESKIEEQLTVLVEGAKPV